MYGILINRKCCVSVNWSLFFLNEALYTKCSSINTFTWKKNCIQFLNHISVSGRNVILHKQDEQWANAHLWYPRSSANRKYESDGSKIASHNMVYLYKACDQISDSCHQ